MNVLEVNRYRSCVTENIVRKFKGYEGKIIYKDLKEHTLNTDEYHG